MRTERYGMRRGRRLPVRYGIVLLTLAALLLTLLPAACIGAQAQERRVLRVAFPEVRGFSQTSEDGSRHGIVVDYLNEIAKYTGWKYDYIDTEGETMTDEFLNGEYDLMGGTYYTKELEASFAYPDYNTGYSRAVLLAERDRDSIRAYDWKSMEGKTIGVYDRAKENIRRLKEFLKINDIDCKLKYYSYEELVDNKLYFYLDRGEVDMLLGNETEDTGRYRVVAGFDSQPHYLVTTVGNQEILDGLNYAMEKIVDSNPNFANECYEANFPDSGIASIYFNEKELDYVERKKSVSVAVMREWHPLFCLEMEGKYHDGVIPDVLKEVKELTGLSFTWQYADSYEEALGLVEEGRADMLGAFLGTEQEGADMELALTKPYAVLNDIIIRNKSVSFPSDGLTGAVIKGRRLPARLGASRVKYYTNAHEAIQAVNRGRVDFFYGLSPEVEQEIQDHRYNNLVPNTFVNDRNNMSFAVKSPAQGELLTIMNKAINSLGREERETLVNQNMIALGTGSLTLMELIYANPVLFAVILSCVSLLVALLVAVAARSRLRSVRMQVSLEKAEAESRAKGEFLSRMSHEIRTPMNAIVGLSDLTCMFEGVPDKVRENLIRLRSSCHYLLSLISDILDMSRIDSQMMTLASEPFSIRQVMEELVGMMSADAERRNLQFVPEMEIQDDILTGDAVRLKQVLTNLISNAFKFTPEGGQVRVCVVQTEHSENSAVYSFRVIDTGSGIPQKDQDRIFEAFEQVGTNCSKSQGTGLGLPISRTIVRLMGGELELISEPGKGSKFYFTVRFPTGAMEKKAAGEDEDISLEHMNILLAEDNDLNAEIAEELLKMAGAAVIRAVNGKEAAELFADSRPGEFAAILMDIRMPVMDGLEACRTIRRLDRPDAAEIPIIAMTANSFQEDSDAAKEAGMNGFLTKPVDIRRLYKELTGAAKKNGPGFAGRNE